MTPAKSAGLLASLGQMPWALVDQMLISATNFVTTVFLARGFTQADLGSFTLVYSGLLFVNSVQSGFVTQPHNILGVSRHGEDYRVYTSSTGISQLLLSALGAALALLLWGVAVLLQWSVAPLFIALAPAILAWQFQEYVRRVLYTEGRITTAFATDLFGYGGQAVMIALLAWRRELTGPVALYVIAGASMVGGVLGLWCIRRSLSRRFDFAVIRENWNFGKWITGGEIVGHWLSAQLFVYLSAAMLGAAAAGVLRAVHTIFGPSRILADVLCNVLPIRFARVLAGSGRSALHTQLVLSYLMAVPVLGGYCLLVAVFARPLLSLLYHDRYEGSASVLAMYSLGAFASYMTMIVAAALRARRHTRELFNGQLYASVIALPVGWVLIRSFGIHGTVLGMLATYVIMMIMFWRAYADARNTDLAHEAGETAEPVQAGVDPAAEAVAEATGRLLSRVFDLFDRCGIRYCVTHGYQGYPQRVRSDVDCILPADMLPRSLADLLHRHRDELGAEIVQWVHEDTYYVVLSAIGENGRAHHLRLDVSVDYELQNHLFLTGEEILSGRRRHGPFWVPEPRMEFACVLVRRVAKARLNDEHARRLNELYALDPSGCAAIVERFWDGDHAAEIGVAARCGDWSRVRRSLISMRRSLLRRAWLRHPMHWARQTALRAARRLARWWRPAHGLNVVLLGPDGAGKSSVASSLERDLAPAFFAARRRSFPPALLNRGDGSTNSAPHNVSLRSPISSVVRALAYWLVYHTVGHYLTVHVEKARFHLVIHDRHLIDTQVDPRRYRYAGPMGLLRFICRVAVQPDLVLVLDAPAETIQRRKREVPIEETARQLAAYRSLAGELRMSAMVDASAPADRVAAEAERVVLQHMAARSARQLRLADGGESCRAVLCVLAQMGADAPTAELRIEALGAGDQASVFVVRRRDGAPLQGGHRMLAVKLFNESAPEVDLALCEEYESLQRLHSVLGDVTLDGWRVHTPEPLLKCESPRALVMTLVPGESLNVALAAAPGGPEAIVSTIAPVLSAALERYWSVDGRIYGDLDLNNILCDPSQHILSFVDPGMPESAYLCEAVERRWHPESRDLAYMLFDIAAAVRLSLVNPDLHRQQRRLVLTLMRAAVRKLDSASDRRLFIEEVAACGQVHLRRIRFSWSWAGLRHILVRTAASWTMSRILAELARSSVEEPAESYAAATSHGRG